MGQVASIEAQSAACVDLDLESARTALLQQLQYCPNCQCGVAAALPNISSISNFTKPGITASPVDMKRSDTLAENGMQVTSTNAATHLSPQGSACSAGSPTYTGISQSIPNSPDSVSLSHVGSLHVQEPTQQPPSNQQEACRIARPITAMLKPESALFSGNRNDENGLDDCVTRLRGRPDTCICGAKTAFAALFETPKQRAHRLLQHNAFNRAYRSVNPEPHSIAKAFQIPFASHPPRFSRGWWADKISLACVAALRMLTPLAHGVIALVLVWAVMRFKYPQTVDRVMSAFNSVLLRALDLVPFIPSGLKNVVATLVKTLGISWAAVEVVFYFWMRRKWYKLNARSRPNNPLPTAEARRAHMKRVLSFVVESGRNPTEYIREWFHGAPFKDIKYENLLEWAAASLLNKELHECTVADRRELTEIIQFIEKVTGIQAEPGHNPHVHSLRLTIDPLRVVHRPLVVYGTIGIASRFVGANLLKRLGFTLNTVRSKDATKKPLTYWYRPGKPQLNPDLTVASVAAAPLPVITVSEAKRESSPPSATARTSQDTNQNSVPNGEFTLPLPSPTRTLFDYSPEPSPRGDSSAGLEVDLASKVSLQRFSEVTAQVPYSSNTLGLSMDTSKGTNVPRVNPSPTSQPQTPGSTRRRTGVEVAASRGSAAPGLSHSERVILAESEAGAVVFVHGIGVGVWTYYTLLERLVERYPYKDIFLPEFNHIAMRLEDYVPAPRESAENLRAMLAQENHSCAVFMGHSYGTFVVGHCLRYQPKMVEHVVQVDPVCFLIHQMDGPFQFIFRRPECPETRLINFIAQTELNIVHTLARKLWWWENIIWEDHVPSGSSVILSAKDAIVPSAAVRAYLQHCAHRVRVLWWEHLTHAGFLIQHDAIDQVLDCIALYWPTPASSPFELKHDSSPMLRSRVVTPTLATDMNMGSQAVVAENGSPDISKVSNSQLQEIQSRAAMLRPIPHPRRLLAMLISKLKALRRQDSCGVYLAREDSSCTSHQSDNPTRPISPAPSDLDEAIEAYHNSTHGSHGCPRTYHGFTTPQPLTLFLPAYALSRSPQSRCDGPEDASFTFQTNTEATQTPESINGEELPELTLENMFDIELHRKRYEKAVATRDSFRELLKYILRLQRVRYGKAAQKGSDVQSGHTQLPPQASASTQTQPNTSTSSQLPHSDCLRTCVSACCVQRYYRLPTTHDDLIPSDWETDDE